MPEPAKQYLKPPVETPAAFSFVGADVVRDNVAMREPALSIRPAPTLADRLEDLLPQTQCTKCGYPDCRAYAEAIASDEAAINQCPPGGAEGIRRLAQLLA